MPSISDSEKTELGSISILWLNGDSPFLVQGGTSAAGGSQIRRRRVEGQEGCAVVGSRGGFWTGQSAMRPGRDTGPDTFFDGMQRRGTAKAALTLPSPSGLGED